MTATHLLWSLRSEWHNGSLRAWTAVAAIIVLALVCVLTGLWYRSAHREESVIQERLAHGTGAVPPTATAVAGPARDFTATLDAAQPAVRWVEVIQGAAARAGLTLTSVQVQEQASTPDRLGRTEMPVVLQGPYPAIKRCLAEILNRIPHSTVARLHWQRAEGAVDTEARLHLVVWSAPALAGAASAARP
jgi:hypothetical protein